MGSGIPLFLLLGAPWFVWMTISHEYFFQFFFIKEHFLRYTTDVHVHEQPIYYFIPILLIGALPFTSSAILAIFKPAFTWRGGEKDTFEPERFLWCFAIFVLVFFSMGNSKLPPYIAPAIAALVLLVSARIARTGGFGIDPWILIGMGSFLTLLGGLAQTFATEGVPLPLYQAVQPWVIASGIFMLLGGVLLQRQRRDIIKALPVAGMLMLLSVQSLLWGFQGMSPLRSGKQIAETLESAGITSDIPIYQVGTHVPSLPFYLERIVTIVTYQSELEGSSEMDGEKMLHTPSEFIEEWRSLDKGAAVFLNHDYQNYLLHFDFGKDSELISRGPKWTVVQKSIGKNL